MSFFPETSLEASQAEAIARGLYAVARVDGVHAREAALVSSFYEETGRGANAYAELERSAPITPAELAAALHQREHRVMFVKTAILLAYADGVVTAEERQSIAGFARALGVDDATVNALESEVKEYLLGHLTHVSNVDATRAVAKKLQV